MARSGSTNPKRAAAGLSTIAPGKPPKPGVVEARRKSSPWEAVDLADPQASERFFQETEDQADGRIRAAVAAQKSRGIVDASGKRLNSELPEEMQSDSYFPV
jgi:hypothetical protein